MRDPNARISRVHQSWRVRVFGHPPRFFSPTQYGSDEAALEAARAWRDAHWDGRDRWKKLTPDQRREIQGSDEHYKLVAERYGIHPQYVNQIRREK